MADYLIGFTIALVINIVVMGCYELWDSWRERRSCVEACAAELSRYAKEARAAMDDKEGRERDGNT